MADTQRKRTLAEWVVKTKKQIVKLYVVAKWSRDAGVVQKAMVCAPHHCILQCTNGGGRTSLRFLWTKIANSTKLSGTSDMSRIAWTPHDSAITTC